MATPSHLSRRKFLLQGATAISLPLFIPSHVLAKPPRRKEAGDQVRLGFIGVGRRGQELLEALPFHRTVIITDFSSSLSEDRHFLASLKDM